MTRTMTFVLSTLACALFFLSGFCVVSVHAQVGITGETTVPGQNGSVEYDIRAQQTGENKFKITVHLRPKSGTTTSFSNKKFYVCMMFQLTKKDCPERERTTKRPAQRRFTLKTVPCTIPYQGPKSDKAPLVVHATCWCCDSAPVDVAERMSYHLGCKEVDLKGQDVTVFDQEVTFKDLQCGPITEDDIESFYWDTFVEESSLGPLGTPEPRRWLKACSSGHADAATPDDLADPQNTCPEIGQGPNGGQDTSMGPEGSIGRLTGVATKGLGGVNIWAGAFAAAGFSVVERACTVSRGQKVRKLAGVPPFGLETAMAPRPIPQIGKLCESCDGKTETCYLATAPLDNFWTMTWHGEYAARLQGTFIGPPSAKVTLMIPGQVTREYEADEQGRAQINETYVIGRDSNRWEKDMQFFVRTRPEAGAIEKMRFDGIVTADQENAVWAAGAFMHRVSFSGAVEPAAIASVPQLPEGMIFATAEVTADTAIEVEQPGYAIIATADVVTSKRVNPGDHLDANTTSSVAFDDGTGMLISVLKRAQRPIEATVGLVPLLLEHPSHPIQLPLNNGRVTAFVGSDHPFTNPAIAIDNVNKVPEKTSAIFLDRKGNKVGQVATFNGLKASPTSKISIRTLDDAGNTVREQPVEGGVLDGAPTVSFDKPVYKAGDKGVLTIGNQKSYQSLVEMTRYGGGTSLPHEPIRILQIANVKGLPEAVPFGTSKLNFEVVHPGQAKVGVIMPQLAPPRPVASPGNDPELKRANETFNNWLSSLPK